MNLSEQIHELNLETNIILREIGKDIGLTLAQVQLLILSFIISLYLICLLDF